MTAGQRERSRTRPASSLLLAAGAIGLVVLVVLSASCGGDDEAARSSAPSTTEETDVDLSSATSTTVSAATTAAGPTTSRVPATTSAGPTTTAAPRTTTPASTTVPAPRTGDRVPPGEWGGPRAELVVTAEGGTVEYECAAGFISEPLVVDASGHFEAQGSHAFGRGGPVQPGTPAPPGQPAVYTGWTDGRQMTFSVRLPEAGTQLGPFEVVRGQAATLDRCL